MFDADTADNAASPIHPDGTVLLIWSPISRGAAVVRVNNAGPYYPGRTLDVSRGVAEKLGFAKGGVMQLLSAVIAAPSAPDAHYRRGRVYPRVSGYLGTFDNLALASLQDPVAREAIFQGNQPVPALALNISQQLALLTTEQHMKSHALAAALASVPNDVVEPPELHSSMIEADSETVAPEAAAVAAAEPTFVVPSVVRVITLSAAQAALVSIPGLTTEQPATDVIRAKVQKAKAEPEKDEPAPRARAVPRPVRVAEETGVTHSRVSGRAWFDGDTPDHR